MQLHRFKHNGAPEIDETVGFLFLHIYKVFFIYKEYV